MLKCRNYLDLVHLEASEATSISSELLECESSVRGILNELNSGMFLNCNANVNVNCKE